jgi:AcrR family transcriptional regulator
MNNKTSRAIQSEVTRERIIAAATQLFLRKGYFATSIADLSAAVEVTKGALYHHFESKEAIFSAVVGTIKKTWRDTVAREVIGLRDPMERLEKLLENHARFLENNESFCLVLNGLMMEMEGINPEFIAELRSAYKEMAGFIEQILVKGQNAGKIRHDIEPKSTALTIVGMLRGTGCSRPISEKMKYDYTATMDVLKKVVIQGLRA